jgi:uncharacterized membrane protein YqjE
MEGAEERKRGILASVSRLVKIIAATATNRVELLLVEYHEERLRLVGVLILAGMLVILALMTLMTATMAIVAFCVKNDHPAVIAGLVLIYLVATFICYWRLRHRLKTWAPFAGTLDELRKDKECWEEQS